MSRPVEERARLRELAGLATAGPWEDDFGEVWSPGYGFKIAVASRLSDAVYITAVSPDVVLGLLDAYDAGTEKILEAVQLAADTMDKLAVVRAERDALAAAVDRARALHTPVRYYTDPCDDPECEREHVELSVGDYYHGDVFELMCEVCSGGDLSECDYDDAVPHPCPTRRALDATPETGGES